MFNEMCHFRPIYNNLIQYTNSSISSNKNSTANRRGVDNMGNRGKKSCKGGDNKASNEDDDNDEDVMLTAREEDDGYI